ncbi:MAG: ribonuclease H [Pseudomonadota bacterium]
MTDKSTKEPWKRMCFKGNKVWAQTDESDSLLIEDDKVLIKYNLKQDYEYRVRPESLKPVSQAVPTNKESDSPLLESGKTNLSGSGFKQRKAGSKTMIEANIPDQCIKIYTDGASSGNPGPAGIGALLIFGDKRKEISQYIGPGTNNIAELTAIKVALEELKRHDLPVRIFSDSSYSIGLLTKGWKPKKNQKLVADIRTLMKKFPDLAFIKVKGHSGIKENEVADYLATSAIKKGLE